MRCPLVISTLMSAKEFLGLYASLPEHSSQRSDLQFTMQRYNTTAFASSHNDVTAFLPNLYKADSFQGGYTFCAADARQFRHSPPRKLSTEVCRLI